MAKLVLDRTKEQFIEGNIGGVISTDIPTGTSFKLYGKQVKMITSKSGEQWVIPVILNTVKKSDMEFEDIED